MNSSNDDEVIEIESSTDLEGNLNTENQSEAEDANNLLIVTNDTSENEAKESEQETSKGKEKANNVAEGGCAASSKPTEYTEKNSRNKIQKPEKKPQESTSKTKSTEEKINTDCKAPKMANRSSSRLKLVPER